MKHLLYIAIIFSMVSCAAERAEKKSVAQKQTIPQKANSLQNDGKQVITKKPPKTNKAKTTTAATRPAGLVSAGSSNSNYKAKNEGWLVNLEEALAQSKKTGKPIMANFTGSDWCGWCKRLDKSVFHQPEFKTWADKNVVLLELDFPKRFRVPADVAQQNQSLKQAFGIRGYPTIWVFDLDKDETNNFKITALGKTGYTKTFQEFKTNVDSFIARRKVDS